MNLDFLTRLHAGIEEARVSQQEYAVQAELLYQRTQLLAKYLNGPLKVPSIKPTGWNTDEPGWVVWIPPHKAAHFDADAIVGPFGDTYWPTLGEATHFLEETLQWLEDGEPASYEEPPAELRLMTFRRYVDDPATDEQELRHRSGQLVTLVGQAWDAEPAFPAEHIVMQRIRFKDGFEADAFAEELSAPELGELQSAGLITKDGFTPLPEEDNYREVTWMGYTVETELDEEGNYILAHRQTSTEEVVHSVGLTPEQADHLFSLHKRAESSPLPWHSFNNQDWDVEFSEDSTPDSWWIQLDMRDETHEVAARLSLTDVEALALADALTTKVLAGRRIYRETGE